MFEEEAPFIDDPFSSDPSTFDDDLLSDDFDDDAFYTGEYPGEAAYGEDTFRYDEYDEFFSDDLEDY